MQDRASKLLYFSYYAIKVFSSQFLCFQFLYVALQKTCQKSIPTFFLSLFERGPSRAVTLVLQYIE
jgi:hypothetical protein